MREYWGLKKYFSTQDLADEQEGNSTTIGDARGMEVFIGASRICTSAGGFEEGLQFWKECLPTGLRAGS